MRSWIFPTCLTVVWMRKDTVRGVSGRERQERSEAAPPPQYKLLKKNAVSVHDACLSYTMNINHNNLWELLCAVNHSCLGHTYPKYHCLPNYLFLCLGRSYKVCMTHRKPDTKAQPTYHHARTITLHRCVPGMVNTYDNIICDHAGVISLSIWKGICLTDSIMCIYQIFLRVQDK